MKREIEDDEEEEEMEEVPVIVSCVFLFNKPGFY